MANDVAVVIEHLEGAMAEVSFGNLMKFPRSTQPSDEDTIIGLAASARTGGASVSGRVP